MSAAVDVAMPKLGDTVTQGTIVRWIVAPGDEIAEGDPIAEIETDKVTTDYPSEYAGIVSELLAAEGQTVPVGDPIVRLESDAEPAPADTPGDAIHAPGPPSAPPETGPATAASPTDSPPAPPEPEPPQPEPPPPAAPSPLRPTGAARAAAAQQGVDLTATPGTGRHGRIRRSDVDAAARGLARPAPDGELVAPSRMRQRIAAHMQESWSASPHALVAAEADVTDLLEWRRAQRSGFRAERGADLSVMAIYVRALARAVDGPPEVGVAVALDDGGLIVPVVRGADGDWGDVAVAVDDVITRARAGGLGTDELEGGTSTITNVGVFGAHWGQPILNHGQTTILALGAAERRPVGLPDGVRWRTTVPLSLIYDRNRCDEIEASSLLGRILDELATFVSSEPHRGAARSGGAR